MDPFGIPIHSGFKYMSKYNISGFTMDFSESLLSIQLNSFHATKKVDSILLFLFTFFCFYQYTVG